MKKRILKFPEEGLQQLQFFMEGLSFPVIVASYSEQDNSKIEYLTMAIKQRTIHSTYGICVWCIRQRIAYQILFQVRIKNILTHPIQIYDYFRLQRALRKCQEQMSKKWAREKISSVLLQPASCSVHRPHWDCLITFQLVCICSRLARILSGISPEEKVYPFSQ